MSNAITMERQRTSSRARQLVPHLLGSAFLVVIVTSFAGGMLLGSALGSSYHSDLLVNLSTRFTTARLGVIIDLLTSCGIVTIAVLLYTVLYRHGKIVARVALALWLLEAMFMALSRLGALALVWLSQSFVDIGSPGQSSYQVLGEWVYKGVYTQAYTMHMFFYCIGGLLWYGLFYRSRLIPRLISIFGLAATAMGLAGIAAEIFGATVPTAVFLPLLGFELVVGLWLVTRGTRDELLQAPE